jgi:uncharacterized membrane protein YbhN (UPF0104 family)
MTETSRIARRRRLLVSTRALIGLGLLGLLIWRLDPGQIARFLTDLEPLALAAAFLVQIAGKFVWTLRWQLILKSRGLDRTFSDLLSTLMISIFFSSFLPFLGGDIVRGHMASRSREDRTLSYSVVFVERLVGLIVLSSVAFLASLIGWMRGDSGLPDDVLLPVAGMSALVFVAGVTAFSWKDWIRPFSRISFLARHVGQFERAMGVFDDSDRRRKWIVVNSLLLQLIGIWFHLACARAVGLTTPALSFYVIVPVSAFAALVPITLNGLGVREGILVGLLVAAGEAEARAGAFALLALLVTTSFAALGGLVYLARLGMRARARRLGAAEQPH